MAFYLGIDIGGTNIACGIIDDYYNIVAQTKVKTQPERGYNAILNDIVICVDNVIADFGINSDEISWVGVGCPGAIRFKDGFIHYSNNLNLNNIPLGDDLSKLLNKPVFVNNDANAAAVAEYYAGAAKGSEVAVIITIGTGIGSGIIISGNIYSGNNDAGGEIGHTVISIDGEKCTCGRNGCFEAYSSATALIRMTKNAIEQYPETLMKKLSQIEGKISARTAFNAMKIGDKYAEALIKRYIHYLSCGIINVINIFQPEVVCIGGGVCNEGDALLVPLKTEVFKEIYTKNMKNNTKITLCKLGNTAGIIGAALLGKIQKIHSKK